MNEYRCNINNLNNRRQDMLYLFLLKWVFKQFVYLIATAVGQKAYLRELYYNELYIVMLIVVD